MYAQQLVAAMGSWLTGLSDHVNQATDGIADLLTRTDPTVRDAIYAIREAR